MQERPVSDLAEIFDAEALVDEPGGRYNIAPTDEAIVVVERDDRRALKGYRWGLIPHWARTRGSRRERSTPEPNRSPRCRRSGSRSGAGVASCPWMRSTSGAAGRCSPAVPDLQGEMGGPLALAGLVAVEEPGDGRGPADLHDRDDDAERGGRRTPQPDAGHRPRRAWPRWLDPRPTDLGDSARSSSRATRSPLRSRRRLGSSTTCGTTARNCSWRSTQSRPAPAGALPQRRGRRRAGRLRHRCRRQLTDEPIEDAVRIGARRARMIRPAAGPRVRPPLGTTATSVPLFQPAASAATRRAASSSSSATTTTRNSVRYRSDSTSPASSAGRSRGLRPAVAVRREAFVRIGEFLVDGRRRRSARACGVPGPRSTAAWPTWPCAARGWAHRRPGRRRPCRRAGRRPAIRRGQGDARGRARRHGVAFDAREHRLADHDDHRPSLRVRASPLVPDPGSSESAVVQRPPSCWPLSHRNGISEPDPDPPPGGLPPESSVPVGSAVSVSSTVSVGEDLASARATAHWTLSAGDGDGAGTGHWVPLTASGDILIEHSPAPRPPRPPADHADQDDEHECERLTSNREWPPAPSATARVLTAAGAVPNRRRAARHRTRGSAWVLVPRRWRPSPCREADRWRIVALHDRLEVALRWPSEAISISVISAGSFDGSAKIEPPPGPVMRHLLVERFAESRSPRWSCVLTVPNVPLVWRAISSRLNSPKNHRGTVSRYPARRDAPAHLTAVARSVRSESGVGSLPEPPRSTPC